CDIRQALGTLMPSSSSSTLPPLLPDFSSLFFNDTAPTDIYTLSLHDALPISHRRRRHRLHARRGCPQLGLHGRLVAAHPGDEQRDRKSTRLNSSHRTISYAVFCLKKKKNNNTMINKRRNCKSHGFNYNACNTQ